MELLPTACIVSDFPIAADAAEKMLNGQFHIRRLDWATTASSMHGVSLVVMDVTNVSAHQVVALLSQLHLETMVVISTLDRNEVDIYLLGPTGLTRQPGLPSLLALPV